VDESNRPEPSPEHESGEAGVRVEVSAPSLQPEGQPDVGQPAGHQVAEGLAQVDGAGVEAPAASGPVPTSCDEAPLEAATAESALVHGDPMGEVEGAPAAVGQPGLAGPGAEQAAGLGAAAGQIATPSGSAGGSYEQGAVPPSVAEDARQGSSESVEVRRGSRRVLLADNDPNVAAILELFLRKSGAEVVSVPHGQAALEVLAEDRFGLLVCDLDMPVMSGEELLDRIGSDPGTPPVFVISGYVDELTSARLRSHRAVVDVLRKPFDLRAFAARVSDLLDGRCGGVRDPGIGLFGEA
jgi:CheY-like chemotaxis protein